jgi:hypothetical protein
MTWADRPFTETERVFMEHIRAWGKKIVVVNKNDILEGAAEVAEIRSFVVENARSLLGFEPEVFFVRASWLYIIEITSDLADGVCSFRRREARRNAEGTRRRRLRAHISSDANRSGRLMPASGHSS